MHKNESSTKNTLYLFDPVARTQSSQNLFWILRPFCRFRMYLFLKTPKGKKEYKYNAGHQVTYSQLLFGHRDRIELHAQRQYEFLLKQLETEYLHRTVTATIYERSITADYIRDVCSVLADSGKPEGLKKLVELDKRNQYNTICRNYVNGDVLDIQDPVFSDADNIVLFPMFKNGRLLLSEADPNTIDFKAEIQSKLS